MFAVLAAARRVEGGGHLGQGGWAVIWTGVRSVAWVLGWTGVWRSVSVGCGFRSRRAQEYVCLRPHICSPLRGGVGGGEEVESCLLILCFCMSYAFLF